MKKIIIILMCIFGNSVYAQQSGITLNYRDAELRSFIEDVAIETRKTFIIDPQVTGKVNLISSEPLSSEVLFETMLSVLKVNGMSAVTNSNGSIKITKSELALTDSALVGSNVQGEQLVTRVFFIKYVDPVMVFNAGEALCFRWGVTVMPEKEWRPLSSRISADNLIRISQIIANIDIDQEVVKTLNLQHTSPNEMAEITMGLTSQIGFNGGERPLLQAIPVKGSRSLILKGMPAILDQYVPILEDIDRNNASRGDMRLIRLSYAKTENVLPVLQQLVNAITSENQDGSNGGASSEITIAEYSGTNMLVINADPEIQQRLAEVIEQIDIPRDQVLVEAIVVEVSENASKELGLQYILGWW